MKLARLLLASGVVLVLGCNNPKAANNENFSKAVSYSLMHKADSGAFCTGPKVDHFSVTETSGPESDKRGLMQLGFIQISSQESTMMGFWKQTVYDLTPKGRGSFIPGKGFCLGTPSLVQIVNFTDPGSNGTSSRVTYTYQLSNKPSWISEPGSQELRYAVPAAFGVVQDTHTFVLTGNGWLDESLAPQ